MTTKILPRLRCPECKELMEWNKVHICKIPQEKETEVSMPKINNKLDILIAIDILWCKLFDGWACEKCGIIQGEPRKGFEKYYCKHLELPLDIFLKPVKKRIMKEIGIDLKNKGITSNDK